MADTSRSQVTITLGRSGQVVKRASAVVDSDLVEQMPGVGVKRSVRDRLGSNVDTVHLDSKRHRGVNGRSSAEASNGVDDTHLSKHDLRYKIMKKSQRTAQQKNVDLRDMLSRKARPSSTDQKNHRSLHEPGDSRQRARQLTPEQKDDRRSMPAPKDGQWDPVEVGKRDDRQLMRDPVEVAQRNDRRLIRDPVEGGPKDDRRLIWEPIEVGPRDDRRFMGGPHEVIPNNDRQLIRDSVEGGPRDDRRAMRVPHMPKLYDDRQPNIEPTDGSMPSRLIPTRTSRSLSGMDLSNTSFSLPAVELGSHAPSHKVLDNSAGLSSSLPLTEEPLRRPLLRPFNGPTPVTYPSQDIHESARPMATPFPIKPPISHGPLKPVGPLLVPQLSMGGGIVQQSQYPVEYPTVEAFLHSLGLDKYVISFKVEEVDMATLRQMGDHDLKELNIPMGPRKKILLALLARNRRQ